MNIVDLIVIAGVTWAVVGGVRVGLVGMIAAAIGSIGGLLIGSALANDVADALGASGNAEVLVATVVVVAAVTLLSYGAQLLAAPLSKSMDVLQLRWLDRLGGGALAFMASLAIAWIVGGVLAVGPSQSIARTVQGSVLLREIDRRFPNAPGVVAELQQTLIDHGMPMPFIGFEPRLDSVDPPSPEAVAAARNAATASTVRITADGCGAGVSGSGVVVAPGVVFTNAHVVAGAERVLVDALDGRHDATPVYFDPDTDLAVLRVDGLEMPPLPIATRDARVGEGAAVLGYPGGGSLVVTPAAALGERQAVGRDIWGGSIARREIHVLQAEVRAGDSGGPFVDESGTVLGLVFARSNAADDIGYALTSDELRPVLASVPSLTAAVDTGRCVQ